MALQLSAAGVALALQFVAPLLEGPFEQTGITFTDEHGAEQKFKLNVGPHFFCVGGFAELIPEQPLAANTRYTIRVIGLYRDSPASEPPTATVSFTTGSEELADETLRPPQLTAASVLLGAPDCGGERAAMACIGGLERNIPKDHELIARRGDKVLLRTTQFVQTDASYGLDEQPDCIELRRRAPDGRRSEPTTICGSALLTRDFQESDLVDHWVQCKDGILGDPSAYDQNEDADVSASEPEPEPGPSSPSPDAGTAHTETPDAGTRNPNSRPAAASGCSVHAAQHSYLQAFTFACAVALSALRRRLRRSTPNH